MGSLSDEPALTLASAAASDAGSYTVQDSNAYENVSFAAASVSITTSQPPPNPPRDPMCFAPHARLRMADGSYKRVGELGVGE